MKKIFLFLVFFLSIFLFSKQTAFAATCTFDIKTPLINGATSFDVSIVSNKSLSPGVSYIVQYIGSSFESAGPSSIDVRTTDANGDIVYTKTTGSGSLSTGTFKIYVMRESDYGKPGTPAWSCVSSDFNVNDNTAGGTCNINVTSANGNKFSTADAVSFNVSFTNTQNDTRRVWIIDNNGNEISNSKFPDPLRGNNCLTFDQLKSVALGTFDAGNYAIRIGTSCHWPDVACEQKFPITASGGTPPTGSTACNACPANCTFSGTEAKPVCTPTSSAPSGTNCTVITRYCGDAALCDPNHVYGCMGGNSGAPGGGGIIGGADWKTPPDVCKKDFNAPSGYTCTTAIGNIQTSAAGFINSIMSLILSLVGGIAVILIIISGYRLMISQGNPENLKSAKEQLTAAIIGLLFVIFALVFLGVIGVNILGLPGFNLQ